MKTYQYDSYDDYKEAQVEANIRKLDKVWTQEKTVSDIKNIQKTAANIICHGTRNGAEQKYFKKYYPKAYVIGTEISETAWRFDHTIQWDFAEQKQEWIEKFDIVYSNSFDHSFDPQKTIDVWKAQLTPNGMLFIEWPLVDKPAKRSDPVGGSQNDLLAFLSENKLEAFDSFLTNGWGDQKSIVYSLKKLEL